MRILLIGGNGFIGSPVSGELCGSGHELAILHRRADAGLTGSDVLHNQGDRDRLSDYLSQLRQFSPDIIIDLILSSGDQARQLITVARELGTRVVAISRKAAVLTDSAHMTLVLSQLIPGQVGFTSEFRSYADLLSKVHSPHLESADPAAPRASPGHHLRAGMRSLFIELGVAA